MEELLGFDMELHGSWNGDVVTRYSERLKHPTPMASGRLEQPSHALVRGVATL